MTKIVLGKRLLHTSQRACWPSPIHRAAPSTRAPVSVASEQTVGQLCNLSLPNTRNDKNSTKEHEVVVYLRRVGLV